MHLRRAVDAPRSFQTQKGIQKWERRAHGESSGVYRRHAHLSQCDTIKTHLKERIVGHTDGHTIVENHTVGVNPAAVGGE